MHPRDLASLAGEGSIFGGSAAEKLERLQAELKPLSCRYDVVVANPPYMGSSSLGKWMGAWVKKRYPEAYRDLCTSFIDRGFMLSAADGYSAMVTMQSWMFLGSFEKLRGKILRNHSISSMAHLGTRAFGAIAGEVVSTAATVFANAKTEVKGAYFRLVDMGSEAEKRAGLLEALADPGCGWFYRADADGFGAIPGSPIAYWASHGMIQAFKAFAPLKQIARPTAGIRTGDNERFLRYVWEVEKKKSNFNSPNRNEARACGAKWFPCHKGGGFRKWYGNVDYLINWEDDGRELSSFPGCDNAGIRYFFSPGISWGTISSANLSVRYSFAGMISEHCGSMCFANDNSDLLCCMALLNSSVSDLIHSILSPTLSFREASIGNTPASFDNEKRRIAEIAAENVEVAKKDWDSFETSWDFERHPLV